EEISERCLPQPVLVIRGRMPIATLNDHTVTVAEPRMTRSTINVEALLAARKGFLVDRNFSRHVVARIRPYLASVEIAVFMDLSAGNGPIDRRARRTQVSVEITLGQRFKPWLIMHVLTATDTSENRQQR